MHHIPDPARFPRDVRAVWREDNARGLDFADFADWELAAESFASAADIIATSEPMEPDAHDVLALVLGNLANACFRAGRPDDAIRHAQRACALRVALVGEDAIAVARARSDLAVMLCAAGRADQARALIDRAISCVEQYAGEEDLRLVVLLENGARMAMAMSEPAPATPYLLRMHALLASHGVPTTRADVLLARISALTPLTLVEQTNDDDADDDAANDDLFDPFQPEDNHASIEPVAPSFAAQLARGLLAPSAADTDVFRGVAFDFTEPVVPVPAAAYSFEPPQAAPALGFTVEYGFAGYQPHDSPRALDLGTIVDSPLGDANDVAYEAPDELLLLDDVGTAAADDEHSETSTVAEREHEPSISASASMTSDDEIAIASGQPDEAKEEANDELHAGAARQHSATPRPRRPFASALRSGRAAAPQSSEGQTPAASSTLAGGAAAVWAFLRNNH